ncbi:uncharacterized protein VP01_3341g2 [Puccinia sorghi]|uniref:Uncharacterized protein n=1 Tax=Puccinia sorghi TaxID=27349 RepID=A0A0L6UX39_9BASI|nr:uncharacterized protein VP01_3341g2 [Puccinia sorghi]
MPQRDTFDCIKTGKQDATLTIRVQGSVILTWGKRVIKLENCLFVPDIVINLISARELETSSMDYFLSIIMIALADQILNQTLEFKCKSCILAKITKKPFKEQSHLASKPFEKIHLDLIGPINPESKSGSQHRGYYPTTICSDGGGEFVGNSLAQFFRDHPIQRLISEPSEHNVRAEQANQTIEQWELVHGKPLLIELLKAVGTPAITLNMRKVQGRKFDSKGEEGKLIGFNRALRSYRIVTKSGRIIKTKHVRFLKRPILSPSLSIDDNDDTKYWKQLIEKEINSIESHDVWENYYKEPPNPLSATWVFKIKDNTHGNPLEFKGQLCVPGFNQIHGTDYEGTYAPTCKIPTVRMLLLYSLHENLNVTQFDVQGAFLHAPLTKDVFIKTRKGVNCPTSYLKFKKSLYVLKQSPKNCQTEICACTCVMTAYQKCFSIFSNSSCHSPNTMLGMKFKRENNKIKFSLPNQIQHGLEELGLTNCKNSITPLTPNLKN